MDSLQNIKSKIKTETSIELIGLVNQTNCNNYLMPMFEAIVNSIQSIQINNIQNGRIDIVIDRINEQQQSLPTFENTKVQPIKNIHITDNGKGFNDENLASFLKAFSTYKSKYGCKGIGRFTWLKVFREVQIESNFEYNKHKQHRHFTYKLPKGLDDNSFFESSIEKTNEKLETKVHLLDINEHYFAKSNQKIETIAKKILEHCFFYFLNKNVPIITISGYDNEQNDKDGIFICINDLFAELYSKQITTEEIIIKKQKFELKHVKLFDTGEENKHRLYYCANNRVVCSEQIKSIIKLSNLEGKIYDNNSEKSFYYIAYLSGECIDNNSDISRSNLTLLEEFDCEYDDIISKKEIRNGIAQNLIDFITPYLEKVKRDKIIRIKTIIENDLRQYLYMLNEDEDFFDDIPPNISSSELLKCLRNKHYNKKIQTSTKFDATMKELEKHNIKNLDDYKDELDKMSEDFKNLRSADLAEYVMHRKIVLQLLEKYMCWDTENKFYKEESIHKLIFPMGYTSEEVKYSNHNLWIIDDKLSFYDYIASDRPLSQIPVIENSSKKEPDLIFFDNKKIFANEDKETAFDNITIVEFKRPDRSNYTITDNPLVQVKTYIDDIKSKNIKKDNGRPIQTFDLTRFYVYIICDINKDLEKILDDFEYTKTPDGNGYYHYNGTTKTYIELISFGKLLSDCQKRNKILFEKLGLIKNKMHY